MSANNFGAIFQEAVDAGLAAANKCTPVPMIVSQRANPLDDNSPVVKQYAPVAGGVCGFAWVKIKPANSGFARWLVKEGKARKDSYNGGVSWSIHLFNQSLTLKEVFASAAAQVFQKHGIKAYADSRMD